MKIQKLHYEGIKEFLEKRYKKYSYFQNTYPDYPKWLKENIKKMKKYYKENWLLYPKLIKEAKKFRGIEGNFEAGCPLCGLMKGVTGHTREQWALHLAQAVIDGW